MRRNFGFPSLTLGLLLCVSWQTARAQSFDSSARPRPRITQAIDDNKRVILRGNTRPEATPEHDRGRAPDDLRLDHMLLQLKRAPETEAALQQFLEDLQTSGSANFHQWISAQEFGERFGVAAQDIDKVTDWLRHYHFKINVVYASGMVIDFSGTAAEVRRAFGVDIHKFDVNGEQHLANTNDPGIPAALAPVVEGIVSLHNFSPHALHVMRSTAKYTFSGSGGQTFALVPADLATIYNLNPLFASGLTGQGQTIVLIEDTDVFSPTDWSTFRSTLGLSSYAGATFTSVHPAPSTGTHNCGAPGVIAPNDAEAILDAEWASASAPSANIEMAACADTSTTFGGLIAMQNLLNAQNPPPALMSVSYGQCEAVNGAAANAAYNSAYQLANAEGVSVFVAAGDSGAAGCDNNVAAATSGIAVNAFASTPYNVAVGGTDFSDTLNGTNSTYLGTSNSANFGSALSYIPEIPWNNSCAGALLSQFEGFSLPYGPNSLCNDGFIGTFLQTTVAGGGGPSACATGTPSVSGVVSGTCKGWAKPSWQNVLGNPSDGVRDTPDVSLFAADGLWSHYYVFCWSDTANGGAACSGAPSGWSGAGGTSFASPIMAGIQALINQKMGERQGNPAPAYYQLANSEYGSNGSSSCNSTNGNAVSPACVFYDVTQGDMDVNCTGHHNCFLDGAAAGVLSTSNNSYKPAYGTNTGWDFATGIGTINAANLVNNWPGTSSLPNFALSASPGSLTVVQGNSVTTTVNIFDENGFTGNVSFSASGLPSGVAASFNPTPASSSSTLTLTTSSSATTGTASVTITGSSGTITSTTTISLTVNAPPPPNFTLSASPATVTIVQGGTGNKTTVTVTPQNGFNANVTLSTSTLPAGVTAVFGTNPTSSSSTLTFNASSSAVVGNSTITISGAAGTLNNNTTVSLTVVAAPPPSPWVAGDVGATGVAGSAGYSNGVFTVKGAGAQIYGTADAFNFVYQPLNGDGSVIARLVSLAGGASYASAGVMIRNTLDPASANAKTAYWPNYNGIFFDVRATSGGATAEPANRALTLPYWIMISRSGSAFFSYTSPDGVNWTQLGTVHTIPMNATVYVGLAVTSGSTSTLATATFDNVSVNPTSPSLPTPWLDQDLGSVGLAGEANYNNGTFSVIGAGTQIYGTADAFHFVYQPLTGDGALTARLLNLQGGAGYVSAGVMIRNTLDPASANIKTAEWPTYTGIYFDMRSVSGGSTTEPGHATVAAPYWIRVSRSGNTFSSYVSPDGVTWTQLSTSQSITMNATVYIGLAVNSGSTSAIASATFDNVSVSAPPPPTPNFTLSASPASVAVTQGASGSSTISITPQNGFNGSVTFTTSTLPNGVSAVFAPNPATASSSLTFTASSTATTGPATITITGTSGSLTATASVSLTVNAAPSFTLSASPSSVPVNQGTSGSNNINVAPQNGFSGSVTFTTSTLPNGVTATFSPNPSTGSSTLAFAASSTATTGPATITVTGTSGSLTATTTVSLTVNAAPQPSYTLSASPASVAVTQGTSGSSTISITPQNGFNGSVTFTTSTLPSGVTAVFAPNPATNSSALTFTASSTATTGPATITITGTSGSLTATTSVSLTVNAAPSFTLSASPSSVTVNQGASGSSNISVAPQNGFSGSVTFTTSTLPNGVTATFSPNPTTGSSSTLTFSASSTATPGPATVTVTGTSGTLTSTTIVSLTVNAVVPPNFTLSASPSSVSVVQGGSGTSTVSVTPQNGFNGSVTLSTGALPSGVTATFSTNPTSTSSTITLAANSTASTGAVNVTITGTSGSLTNSTSVTLTVTASGPPGLPAPWVDGDVGATGVAGSAGYSNGVFTVKGAGAQIYGTADAFNFVYQPLNGDGSVIARLVSLAGGASYASAGVMIRNTLDPASANAKTAYWPNYNGIFFDVRATSGGATAE